MKNKVIRYDPLCNARDKVISTEHIKFSVVEINLDTRKIIYALFILFWNINFIKVFYIVAEV